MKEVKWGFLFSRYSMLNAVEGRPAADPSSWITTSDYPKSEISRGVSGLTGFTLFVNKSGTVDDCTVTASSGSVTLDATACALLKARARFDPARDKDGHKIPFTYSSGVRWNLPDNSLIKMPVEPETMAIAVDIDPKGVIQGCTVVERPKDGSPDGPTLCVQFPIGKKIRPYTDGSKPIAVRMTLSEKIVFERH